MILNFKGVETKEFKLLDEGNYNARVQKIEAKTSSKDNPYLGICFVITDEGKGLKGRLVWDNFYLSEKAIWKFKQLLDAAGMDTEGDAEGNVDFNPGDLVGAEVNIKVGTDSYEGKDRNVVLSSSEAKDTVSTGFDF